MHLYRAEQYKKGKFRGPKTTPKNLKFKSELDICISMGGWGGPKFDKMLAYYLRTPLEI